MLQPRYDGILFHYLVACEQALWGPLSAGQELEGELATMSLEFEFPGGSPSTKLSDFHQSARSRSECECKKNIENTHEGTHQG